MGTWTGEEEFIRELARGWGHAVRRARLSRRLSQRALADKAGVTQQSISQLEKGEVLTTERHKYRLARALDMEVASLFPSPPCRQATRPELRRADEGPGRS